MLFYIFYISLTFLETFYYYVNIFSIYGDRHIISGLSQWLQNNVSCYRRVPCDRQDACSQSRDLCWSSDQQSPWLLHWHPCTAARHPSPLCHRWPATQRHHVIITLSPVTSYTTSHRHHDISYIASSSVYHQWPATQCHTVIMTSATQRHHQFIISDQLHSVTTSSSLYHQSPATQRHHVIITLSLVTSYTASHHHHHFIISDQLHSVTLSSSLYHQWPATQRHIVIVILSLVTSYTASCRHKPSLVSLGFSFYTPSVSFCFIHRLSVCLQCFDTVGWTSGRVSGL